LAVRLGPDQYLRVIALRYRESGINRWHQRADELVHCLGRGAEQDDCAIAEEHAHATARNGDRQGSNAERLVAFERARIQTLPEKERLDRHRFDRTRRQLREGRSSVLHGG